MSGLWSSLRAVMAKSRHCLVVCVQSSWSGLRCRSVLTRQYSETRTSSASLCPVTWSREETLDGRSAHRPPSWFMGEVGGLSQAESPLRRSPYARRPTTLPVTGVRGDRS
uniref:Putative secreted protein n=1 Tax=Ixodes ricinus TaxID=34613 RepID=A0A6B0UIZ2_IXORI